MPIKEIPCSSKDNPINIRGEIEFSYFLVKALTHRLHWYGFSLVSMKLVRIICTGCDTYGTVHGVGDVLDGQSPCRSDCSDML
jgi:hypothetical protein